MRYQTRCVKEQLAKLLGTTVAAIHLPVDVADQIATALRQADEHAERDRREAKQRLEIRRRAILAKLDRGYDDYVTGKITEEFWSRKSEQWEDERRTAETELGRLQQANGSLAVKGEKILELSKKAEFLYKTQTPLEQRRLLETLLSNCTFDRGSLCPTYAKPFDLFANANETGNWRREWDSNPR
jgi:hypothetical protein